MKHYRIEVKKVLWGQAFVEANSEAEAREKFNKDELEHFEDFSDDYPEAYQWEIETIELDEEE